MSQSTIALTLLTKRSSQCPQAFFLTTGLKRINGEFKAHKTFTTASVASIPGHSRIMSLETNKSLPWLKSSTLRYYSNQRLGPHSVIEHTTATSIPIPPLPHYVLRRAPTPFQAIVKPVLFTVIVSLGAFTSAAYLWERNQVTLLKKIQAWRSQAKNDRPTAGEFARAQAKILKEKWVVVLERFRWIQEIGIPLEVQKALFMMRAKWMELTPAERTIWAIIGLNSIVFGAWKVPRLTPFMERWFMHHPAHGKSITLLTSIFSHQHFWHFGLNMFALHSFAMPLHEHMGREQFLAFYLTTGLTASLASHLFTVARVSWAKMIPSLGASGALFGCLSSIAYLYPNASAYIIFLPFLSFKMPVAVGAMMALDLAGVIRNWRIFDHYAHLAGSTFGLAYIYAGKDCMWSPLQQKAIELNKDTYLFGKLNSKSPAQTDVTGSLGNGNADMEGRSAKEIAVARYNKIKAWWDIKRSGGDRE